MARPVPRNDTLHGTSENDVLVDTHQFSKMAGNGGNDTFVFTKHGSDSPAPHGDHDLNNDHTKIVDFSQGDTIDISQLGVGWEDITVFSRNSRHTEIKIEVDGGHDQFITVLGKGFDLSDLVLAV